jgi:lipoprotein-releasing system permease protein
MELFANARILTWQQLNNAFYSALLLEKTLMYLFLFFMFVILGVNIRNASARLLFVKRKELAIQRAMGSYRGQTTLVFILQAVIITALGEIVGIAAGLFVSANINKVFSWINTLQYGFTGRNNPLLSYPFVTLVKKEEVFIVAVSVLLLAMSFAYLGCRRLLKEEPMEMLYHE